MIDIQDSEDEPVKRVVPGVESEEPSSFTLAIERKIHNSYLEGYQEGMYFVFLAFVMACMMTFILRRLFDGSI